MLLLLMCAYINLVHTIEASLSNKKLYKETSNLGTLKKQNKT